MSDLTHQTDAQQKLPEMGVSAAAIGTPPKLVATKFSDLNAYHQFLQTRTSVAFATYALTAAASGAAAHLLPLESLPPHALPIPVYAAAVVLSLGIWSAATVVNTNAHLRQLLIERLGSRSLSSPDDVGADLQSAFITEFHRKHRGLRIAHIALGVILSLLMSYAWFVLLTVFSAGMLRFALPASVLNILRSAAHQFDVTPSALVFNAIGILLTTSILYLWYKMWRIRSVEIQKSGTR